MTLIDYFNAFHIRSQEISLTPNARSLYFAILGEFNKLQYPPKMKLQNTYLQHLSGINSTSSFRSALNALVNANIISQQKQVYSLKDFRNTSEILPKEFRKTSEIVEKDSLGSISISKNKEKEKEIKKELDEEYAPAQDFSNIVSAEVLTAWKNYKGEKLEGGKIFGLHDLEKIHGTEVIIQAIKTASESNNYEDFPYITYNYFKKILENQLKGDTKNDGQSGSGGFIDNSQYSGVDIF